MHADVNENEQRAFLGARVSDALKLKDVERLAHMSIEEIQLVKGACNKTNKQKPLYANFVYDPPLSEQPPFDIIGDAIWNDLESLYDFGKN